MKTRLIIDTDTAGDDAFSLLLALRHPDAQLEAVTICNGNVEFEQQVENALYTIDVSGRSGEVPVYRGCPRPIMGRRRAATFHGSDGMSEAGFPRAKQRPETAHAVDAIIDLIMANPGEISLIAQAPLTNVALAYLKEPRIAQAIKHLWIMGGTDNGVGNASPTAEFNFFVDPEAAKIVFGAGFPITLSTWTLTLRSGSIAADDVERIERLDTPLSRFFMTVSRVPRIRAFERYGKTISTHPDSLTCACAIDEGLILESASVSVDIEVGGETTRGFSSIYPARLAESWPDRDPNARVIRSADTGGFVDMLVSVLRADA
jgi:purine nucleosidase